MKYNKYSEKKEVQRCTTLSSYDNYNIRHQNSNVQYNKNQ